MLHLRLLGPLAIEHDGATLAPPSSRRACLLLARLALDRRAHSRTELACWLWPDVLEESARTSLRTALAQVRAALGPAADCLLASRDTVALAGPDRVSTDTEELDRRLAAGEVDAALELAGGDLLAGLDDDWVYERRDELRDRLAAALGERAAAAEMAGDVGAAVRLTRRLAGLDPLAEEPQRELMRRLAATGDRAGALKAYERFSERLRDELRIAPSAATRELAEELRQEPRARPAAAVTGPAGGGIVTLLFTDLVGSTELLVRHGDDEAERLRRAHFGLLRDVAAAHGGQEVKNLGDGLMVAFSSAVDALGCAVGIQQAVQRDNARAGDGRFQVRVGLNVGEAIRHDDDYFGTPVVVAKRLCDQAAGGQILASELIRDLVGSRGGFAFRSVGPLALKGVGEPLPACEVAWEPATEQRVPLPPALAAPPASAFVGREPAWEALEGSWAEAREGRRRVALLVGEPGIGKTRLAGEFCRAAYAEGATVLLGRCYEESLVPYQPFVEALRDYVAACSLDELRLRLGPHGATLGRLVPELAERVAPPAAAPADEDAERERFRLFDAVGSVLCEIAASRPLILVLEDLHWGDAPALALLRHVVRRTEHAPLLVLGTYRGTELGDDHPLAQALGELRRARAVDSVAVAGLGDSEIAAIISAQAGREPPADVARAVRERTEGNPFFVEELLRAVEAEDDWATALARLGVPESVKDLLLRRLRRLDDACRRLLTIAGVVGREFTLDVLHRVAGTSPDEIAETLEQAIAAHAVVERGEAIGHYGFAHALIRETVYEQLSGTRRAQLHRRVGEALESASAGSPDELAGVLAHHFSAAGEVAKAFEYHALAADTALRVSAFEPALAHATAALQAGDALGLDAGEEERIRRLLLKRALVRFRTGDYPSAGVDVEAVLDAARRSGDRAMEMRALNELGFVRRRFGLAVAAEHHEAALAIAEELGEIDEAVLALDRLSLISSNLLDLDRALALGKRALELARGTGDELLMARAMDSLKLAALQLGDLGRLEELTRELERILRRREDLWYLQWTLLESAFVPIAAARWDEAAQRLSEAAAINRRVGDPANEPLVLDAQCWLHRSRGEYEQALAAGRRAVALGGLAGWQGWAAATLGCVYLDLRAGDRAAATLEGGLEAAERVGARNDIGRCLSQLAWARLLLGAEEEARRLADRAEQLLCDVRAPAGGAFVFGAHAYAAVARVRLAAGDPERGGALLRPLLAAAERSGWREAVAVSALVLGLCAEAAGELEAAAELIGRAVSIAEEFGLPACAWEGHAALARLHRLAGRPDDAASELALAEAIVERVSAGLADEALRGAVREQVLAAHR